MASAPLTTDAQPSTLEQLEATRTALAEKLTALQPSVQAAVANEQTTWKALHEQEQKVKEQLAQQTAVLRAQADQASCDQRQLNAQVDRFLEERNDVDRKIRMLKQYGSFENAALAFAKHRCNDY